LYVALNIVKCAYGALAYVYRFMSFLKMHTGERKKQDFNVMPKKTIVELSVATMTNKRTNARNQNDCIVS
jgi:hypothetical protein